MKIVNDFNDFLLDILLETENKNFHGVTELPFIISLRLKNLLDSINHPIAKKLVDTFKSREDKKVTFVDYSDEYDNKFTLVNSNKAFDNVKDQYGSSIEVTKDSLTDQLKSFMPSDGTTKENFWTKNRAEIRIGSFVGKVFSKEYKQSGDPGNDIESFVQDVIAKRKSMSGGDRFKILKGQDIVKYYDQNMYDVRDSDDAPISGSPLAGSCMRYDYCNSYINFYSENSNSGVSMLVLFSDTPGKEDKIVGRAIVWELSSPSGRTFMDRIYYRYESDMALFKQYAQKQGWLYKNSQNMDASASIVDPVNGTTSYKNMRTVPTFKTTRYYPYMDTMKWFNVEDGYLTNDEDEGTSGNEVYFLEDTGGGYDESGGRGMYVEFYDDYFDEDDLVYCENGDEYRLPDDAIYIEQWGEYATQDYVDDRMSYSEYDDRYYPNDEVTYSDYHGTYINDDDVIELSAGAEEESIDDIRVGISDYRHQDEISDSVIEYQSKDGHEYYFDKGDYGENFVEVPLGEDDWRKTWKHKIWDKDKLYKHNGKWYYEFDPKVRDKVTGQKRIWDNKNYSDFSD